MLESNQYLCGDCKRYKEMPKVKHKGVESRYCKIVSRIVNIKSSSCVSYNETNRLAKYKNINQIIKLYPVKNMSDVYSWECPNHEGSFSYSEAINRQWGHPVDKVFCAVCGMYYDFEIEDNSTMFDNCPICNSDKPQVDCPGCGVDMEWLLELNKK